MTKEQFRVGSIKTMQGPFTVDSFNKKFPNHSSRNEQHVFVFGGHTDHLKKSVFAPLAFEEKNTMAQFARELEAYDVANCGLPFDQALNESFTAQVADIPRAAGKKQAMQALLKLFYSVGLGCNLVLPIRPTRQHNVLCVPKFDMSHHWRTELAKQGILPNAQMSLDLWDGICSEEWAKSSETKMSTQIPGCPDVPSTLIRDLPEFTNFAKFYSSYANTKHDLSYNVFLGLNKQAETKHNSTADNYLMFTARSELFAHYSIGFIKLNTLIKKLSACSDEQQALDLLNDLQNEPFEEKDYFDQDKKQGFTQAEYCKLLKELERGILEKAAVKENRSEALLSPRVVELRQEESLSIGLCKPTSLQHKKVIDDIEWQKAIALVKKVALKIDKFAPVKVIRPKREQCLIEIGFVEPREWMSYHPSQKAVTISRHCTDRSFLFIVQMAIEKKMTWLDASKLPEDQVQAIKNQVTLLKAQIEVRDANYKPLVKSKAILPKLSQSNAPLEEIERTAQTLSR